MFDKQNILKNISKPDEKLIFSKAFDRACSCIKNYEPTFTEFLDPYKISFILSIFKNKYDFNIKVFGGMDNCERQKIGFFPEFMSEEDYVFPISVIEIAYNAKFSKNLSHRDFLGSVMGLGIDRGKIGDILIKEGKAFLFADDNIAEFICSSLERVGHTKVKARVVSEVYDQTNEEINDIKTITAASLRIDVVLSGVFNLSRSRAAEFIKAEKVFINWSICESVSKIVSQGDVITLRGVGRAKIAEAERKTKKGRFLIVFSRTG